MVGPRKGRFVNGEVVELFEGNKILQSLGTFILWFGWYGFNCGSTLKISENTGGLAGKVAVTTTIAAAAGAIVATFLSKVITGTYDISLGLNGVLAGLVSIGDVVKANIARKDLELRYLQNQITGYDQFHRF